MQSTRSVETGRKLTKYKCYVGFYDFSSIQGKVIGTLLKVTGFSDVTHVGPIIETQTQGDLCITICAATRVNGRLKGVAKVHSPKTLEKLGVKLISKIPVGEFELDLEQTVREARMHTDVRPWDLIFHHFVGRFLGLTRPRACSSFVCNLFGLADAWHPATLWRLYDNNRSGR
jgi:hypothetical protein